MYQEVDAESDERLKEAEGSATMALTTTRAHDDNNFRERWLNIVS